MTAQRLNQLDDAHRDATLVAFLLATEEELIDKALDMHDKLLHQQGKRGEQKQAAFARDLVRCERTPDCGEALTQFLPVEPIAPVAKGAEPTFNCGPD